MRAPVLIPLNSGLVFTFMNGHQAIIDLRLNPFEFRAGIYLFAGAADVFELVVLIPLNSGLVFTSRRTCSFKPLLTS